MGAIIIALKLLFGEACGGVGGGCNSSGRESSLSPSSPRDLVISQVNIRESFVTDLTSRF
jgi:hypothetical protein